MDSIKALQYRTKQNKQPSVRNPLSIDSKCGSCLQVNTTPAVTYNNQERKYLLWQNDYLVLQILEKKLCRTKIYSSTHITDQNHCQKVKLYTNSIGLLIITNLDI